MPRLPTTPRLLGAALALGLALTATAPALALKPAPRVAPALYTESVRPILRSEGVPNARWSPEVVVRRDGRFVAGDRRGTLSRAHLRTLHAAIRATRFTVDRGDYPRCRALPVRQVRVETARGSVSWASPCGLRVDASVGELTALVRRLIGPAPAQRVATPPPAQEAPALVSYRVDSLDRPLGEAIVVRADGTWTRVDGRRGGVTEGRLSRSEVTTLMARLRSAAFRGAPNPPMCAARLTGFATLEAPGVGSHRWQQPCGQPHPTLASALADLRRLTAR